MEKSTDSKKGIRWILFGFAVLFAVLVSVMVSDCMAWWMGKLLGTKGDKAETIRFIGWAISGAFVATGLIVLNRRTEAQADAATAQAKSAEAQANATKAQVVNNELAEKGYEQERFKTATEHLGNKEASVRIAAFYEFFHLIKDNGEEYRKSVLDILFAHIRATTTNPAYGKEVQERGTPIRPTEEIQGLLDALFKSEKIDLSDVKKNLIRADLSGADLINGNFSNVDFSNATLTDVKFHDADLSDANFREANLSNAELFEVKLKGANFFEANLSGADLVWSNLFETAILHGIDLSKATVYESDISGANLSSADISETELEGTFYTNTTKFPEWFVPPAPPENGDKVQFPAGFVARKKSEDDE